MPIQRIARRAQTWHPSGYICHSCRHKLLTRQVPLQQRWQSKLSTSSAHHLADDWVSNFNDLRVTPPPRAAPKARIDTTASTAETGDGGDVATNEKSNGAPNDTPRKKLAIGRGPYVESAFSKGRLIRPSQDAPKKVKGDPDDSVASLKRALSENLNSASPVVEASAPTVQVCEEQGHDQGEVAALTSDTTPVRGKKRSRSPSYFRSRQRSRQRLTEARRAAGAPKQSDHMAQHDHRPAVLLQTPPTDAVGSEMRRKFEQVMQSLTKTAHETLQEMLNERKSISKEEQSAEAPSNAHASTPADLVSRTQNDVEPDVESPQTADSTLDIPQSEAVILPTTTTIDGARSEQPMHSTASTIPKSISIPASISPFPGMAFALQSARSPSLAQKVREGKSRAKWGGKTSTETPSEDGDAIALQALYDSKPPNYEKKITPAPFGLPDSLFDPTPADSSKKSSTKKDTTAAFGVSRSAFNDFPADITESPWSIKRTSKLPAQPQSRSPRLELKRRGQDMGSLQQTLALNLKNKDVSDSHSATQELPAEVGASDQRLLLGASDGTGSKQGGVADEDAVTVSLANSRTSTKSGVKSRKINAASDSAPAIGKRRLTSFDERSASNMAETPFDAGKSMRTATSGGIAAADASTAAGPSGINGASGGDDGEHKPLWEVMAKADSLAANATSKSKAAEPSEAEGEAELPPLDLSQSELAEVLTIEPSALQINPLNIPQPKVPGLEYGLDRVLFNPGIYQLQDPLSRVYNFDPYLQKIMPVAEFDFNALKEYKSSSQDTVLSALAKEHHKRYIGSTSSMTSTLAHFHYLISDWRPIDLKMLSRGFSDKLDSFTQINRAPNAIFLRWKNGTYAIDADKEYDSGNVLMLLGKSMEKLLTTPTAEYERYRKSDPRSVPEEERTAPEAFEYTTMGDFLMRSQLDSHDPRLPGTGMFDLKTRAVVSVRMDAEDYKPMTGYEIYSLQGRFGSYEREYYDMMRSTMLKYMLQVRMGRMDGIFVAYHNVERIFGFQYLPVQELDRALHGQVDPCLGDQEFKTSLDLLNKVLNKATAKFPEQSLRFHFETTEEALSGSSPTTVMWIFAEPMAEQEIDDIQATTKAKIAEFERTMMGVDKNESRAEVEKTTQQPDATHDNVGNAGAVTEPSGESTNGSAPASDASSDRTPEYNSSHSDANPTFIRSMASAASQDRKPLFAASLICKTRVNGVSQARPSPLKRTDEWKVEYLLREWDAPEAMWARYEQMKARRKDMFEKSKDEDEALANGDAEGSSELRAKQKSFKQFTDFLKSMSQSGREFRAKMDALEEGKQPVVVGEQHSAALSSVLSQNEKVNKD